MKSRWGMLVSVIAAAALAAACASGPGAGKAPEWVLSAPEDKDGYMFFTGSGDRGNLAQSEEAANAEVIDKVITFVGVEITAKTDATIVATLESYKGDLTSSIQKKSALRLKSLELAEKWVDPKKGTAVHVLYRARKQELLEEQKRLDDLFKEILELVAKPEAEAGEYAAEGRYYDAAVKYIQAAAAASGLEIPNKDVKFERNVAAAKDALGRINILVHQGDNTQAVAGREMPNAFQAIVVTGAKSSDQPVPDVSVKVSYRVMGTAGRMRTDTVTAKSDEEGIVSFALPVPRFVGSEKITVTLNAGPYLEPLEKAPKQYQSAVTGLEQLAAQKRATFSYTVLSMAREVPMGVAVADVDSRGVALASTETAAGIVGELGAQKFRVRALKVAADRLVGVGDADLAAYLKQTFAAEVKRAAFGVCQVTGSEKDGDRFVARVRAVVKVYDFESGETRLAVEKSASALGSSAEAAAAAAFRKAGELVAQDVAAGLW